MPKYTEKKKSGTDDRRAIDKKRILKKGGGNGGRDDEDDDSIDSRGNIRNLINYDYTSESDTSTPSRFRVNTSRRAAVDARKKINEFLKRRRSSTPESKPALKTPHEKDKPKKNKTIYSVRDKLTPIKRHLSCKTRVRKSDRKRRSYSSESASEASSGGVYRRPRKYKSNEFMSETEESCVTDTDDEDTEDETTTSPSKDTNTVDTDTTKDNKEDTEDEEETESESESESESDDEDDSNYEDENEEDGENEENEENKEGSKSGKKFGGIILTLGGGGAGMSSNPMIPKKFNMKKEPDIVKKFVKLVTAPVEENTIDTQIEEFKALSAERQKDLVNALENRPVVNDTGIGLMLKILTLKLPREVQGMILSKYNSLQTLEASSNEYYKLRSWLDKVVNIPFGIYKEIPARLEDGADKCADFMRGAKKCLDHAVYGQEDSKLQIMQFISTKIANPESRGLSLLLVGPPGIGKTASIKNGIAKALGWPFQFISLGGDSDASTYTGHQLVYESSHCGKIVNSLIASKSMSTVLMFDEVDKISQTPKGEEVMNLLIHLTDPVQNDYFEDKYLAGVPIDLSKVMFIFSANDINKIDKVLLDRMMVINLKGYSTKEKTVIAEQYLLPAALKEVNLTERVSISKDILTTIIEEYTGEEKGVRELKRCIEQVTQKINMLRMYNSPELPFYIKDFSLPFIVKKDHLRLFLKKKEDTDAPPAGMYC
jgi:hypothetical protein